MLTSLEVMTSFKIIESMWSSLQVVKSSGNSRERHPKAIKCITNLLVKAFQPHQFYSAFCRYFPHFVLVPQNNVSIIYIFRSVVNRYFVITLGSIILEQTTSSEYICILTYQFSAKKYASVWYAEFHAGRKPCNHQFRSSF